VNEELLNDIAQTVLPSAAAKAAFIKWCELSSVALFCVRKIELINSNFVECSPAHRSYAQFRPSPTDNQVSDQGAAALGEALGSNGRLLSLHLGRMPALPARFCPSGFQSDVSNLFIDSRGSFFSGHFFLVLKRADGFHFSTHCKISAFVFFCPSPHDPGKGAFSYGLQPLAFIFPNFTTHFPVNVIGSRGAAALARALRTNSTLETLDLYSMPSVPSSLWSVCLAMFFGGTDLIQKGEGWQDHNEDDNLLGGSNYHLAPLNTFTRHDPPR